MVANCGLFSWADVTMALVLSWGVVNVVGAVCALLADLADEDEG